MAEVVLDSVERVAAVLDACAKNDVGMSVREVAAEISLSKSAVHRLMFSLAHVGLLRYDSGRQRYFLGLGILELSSHFAKQSDIVSITAPSLRDLRDLVDETVCLHLEVERRERIVLSQYESNHELRFVATIGRLVPLHVGSGRALLASFSPEELDFYIQQTDLIAHTASTITDSVQLREMVEVVKSEGTLVSRGEFRAGAMSIAAPIVTSRPSYLAVSIFAPQGRIGDERLDLVREQVKEAAESCAAALNRFAPS